MQLLVLEIFGLEPPNYNAPPPPGGFIFLTIMVPLLSIIVLLELYFIFMFCPFCVHCRILNVQCPEIISLSEVHVLPLGRCGQNVVA